MKKLNDNQLHKIDVKINIYLNIKCEKRTQNKTKQNRVNVYNEYCVCAMLLWKWKAEKEEEQTGKYKVS